jgi:hypothetical protein
MLSYLNYALCVMGMAICVNRLGTKMSLERTKGVIRLQYVMWLGVDMFMLTDFPTDMANVVTSGAIFLYLVITMPAWRFGAPPHTIKDNSRMMQ